MSVGQIRAWLRPTLTTILANAAFGNAIRDNRSSGGDTMGQAREVMDRLTAAAVESHDVDSMLNLYADNAIIMTPDAGQLKGTKQIGEYWHQFVDAFPDSKYQVISKLEAGNKAVDEGYFIGTHSKTMTLPTGQTIPPTGKQVKVRSCDVATVESGKINEHHMYFDEVEFLRQLGLDEV
jgi:steroid delta-isomerase-like uncharacterized protein